MQDERENPDYTPAEAEAASGVSDDEGAAAPADSDDEGAAAPADPPMGDGADEAVLDAPEVPDDANDKISAAQQHLNTLNMDEQRNAAQQSQKKL